MRNSVAFCWAGNCGSAALMGLADSLWCSRRLLVQVYRIYLRVSARGEEWVKL
jgi:hypothetical protein